MLRFLKRPAGRLIRKVADVAMNAPGPVAVQKRLWELGKQVTGLQQCVQILLSLKYKSLYCPSFSLKFSDVEFRAYSQTNEDGIIALYFFHHRYHKQEGRGDLCGGWDRV